MTLEIKAYEFAEGVETEEEIQEYLSVLLEEEGADVFIAALGVLAKKQGMTEVSRKSGVNRQNLYRTLKEGGNPNFSTVHKVVESLGCKLAVV